MRNKKSVLKTLSVSYDCSNEAVTGIAGNNCLNAMREAKNKRNDAYELFVFLHFTDASAFQKDLKL